MSMIRRQVAVAVAAVGANLIQNDELARVAYDRVLTGVGYVGSSAAGNSIIDVFVGMTKVATVGNSAVTLGIQRADVLSTRARVGAGQEVRVIVVVAPASPVVIYLHFLP